MVAARSLFEITSGMKHKGQRTFQPVRRNSYDVSDRRSSSMWQPIDRKQITISNRLRAAEQYDREKRQPGQRNGPLGHIGVEVLRCLYRLVDFKTGRLEPSIDYIASRLKRSRSAIVAALAALKEHGFLDWVRRSEPRDDIEGKGPQIRQISNAYALKIPAAALAFIKHIAAKAPQPVDDADRRAADREATEAMLTSLPLAEEMQARVSDPGLADALARLGAALDPINASSPSGQNPTRKN